MYLRNTELPITPLLPERRAELHDLVTRDWCKPLADAGVSYRVTVMDGRPSVALMQAAQTENAELVVTGRRARDDFAELLLGSTTHHLSNRLDRPASAARVRVPYFMEV